MADKALGLLAFFTAIAVAIDPYTWALNASDASGPPSWWQIALSATVIVITVTGSGQFLRGRLLFATVLVGGSTVLEICRSVMLIHRDGLSRFSHGFGGEEYLSIYLLVIAVRVVVVTMGGARVLRDG